MLASAFTFWRWLTGQPVSLDATDSPAASVDSRSARSARSARVSDPAESSRVSDPADERRVYLRYAASLNIRCQEVGEGGDEGIAAVIADISRGGLRVIAPCRFEPGTVLSVELPAVSGESSLAVLVCVVRATPHGEREWAMGCRFSGELNDEQLQALGAARTRPTPPDARTWSRYPCDVKAVYQSIAGRDTSRRSARVLNISAAGMALLVDENIAIGELLSTELHDGADKPVVTILACVVHVQKTEQGRVLGCNFIRELTDDDLKALV